MRTLTAAAGIWLRAGRGGAAAKRSKPPPQPKLFLYEYEGSPWCRRVREHVCQLDLAVNIRPCPREVFFSHVGPPLHAEGWSSSLSRFRPLVKEQGGQIVFPFLVDEDQQVVLNGSGDIVRHLWERYGSDIEDETAQPMSTYNLASRLDSSGTSVSEQFNRMRLALTKDGDGCRFTSFAPLEHKGVMLTPSRQASEVVDAEVELYAHEACVGSRLLREALCSLQIPYVLIPCAAGSAHQSPSGCTPFLRVGERCFSDASEGVDFLFRTFATGPTRTWFARKGDDGRAV